MMTGEAVELRLVRGVVRGLRFGDTAGPKVLGLHGWLDNAHSFVPLAPFLRQVDLVCIDLPGHGLSDHRAPGVVYHFVDWPADVIAVLDALGWERAALLGHSMGAGIASLVAGLVPERLRALVLLEGLGPFTSAPETVPDTMRQALEDLARLEQRVVRPYVSREVAARQLMKAVPLLPLESALLLCERGMREVSGGFVWRADPRLRAKSLVRMTQEMVLAFLRRITAPTLLVQGRQGLPFDAEIMGARLKTLGAATALTHALIDGGHHVHMSAPQEVAALVAPYLDGSR